jgi:hypothetical protein
MNYLAMKKFQNEDINNMKDKYMCNVYEISSE